MWSVMFFIPFNVKIWEELHHDLNFNPRLKPHRVFGLPSEVKM